MDQNPSRELYLALLEMSLTGSIAQKELVPLGYGKPNLARYSLIQKLIRLIFGDSARLCFEKEIVTDRRLEGKDWPVTGQTMVGVNRLRNLRDLYEKVRVENIPGDLFEAGVWKGGASIYLRGLLEAFGDSSRCVWVADSFSGFSKVNFKGNLADSDQKWFKYRDLEVTLEEVKRNFAKYGFADAQVKFVEGLFEQTLPNLEVNSISILRADGDLYTSTTAILENLEPKVAPGGFVVIDDLSLASCREAVDDYREKLGISSPIHKVDWTAGYWRKGD